MSLFAAGAYAQQVTVEITGVDNDLRQDMLGAITLARQKDRERLTLARVKALFDRASKEIGNVLQAYGYYQPHIDAHLDQAGDANWRARFAIQPGPRTRISEVALRLNGAES